MHLGTLDFVVLVAYFAGLAGMGAWFSRRQKSEETYFLGDRNMPWLVVGVSIMATLISTLTYLALPGEMISHGTGYFLSLLAYVGAIPFVNRIVIPALMRLPVTSVYEYFERRYHLAVRSLAAVVFVLMRLGWIGLIIYTASFAVVQMTGWSMPSVVLFMGVFTTFYTTAGGIQAVVWSDFAQGVLLLGGALFVPVYVAWLTGAGPIGWWETFSQAGRAAAPVWSLDLTVRITVVGIILEQFFWHVSTHSADQVAAQRYLSTPSIQVARRSFWVSALFTTALIGLLMLVGLALFYYEFRQSSLPLDAFQQHIAARADKVFPDFIARVLPSGVAGLLLAAILAAAMSSLSSGINSITTVVMADFVERMNLVDQRRRNVLLAMAIAAVVGMVGIGVALLTHKVMLTGRWNLVEMIERVNHLFVSPLGGLFIAGVLLRRVGTGAALAGFAAGVATSVLVSFSQEICEPLVAAGLTHHLPAGLAGAVEAMAARGLSFTWIMPFSLMASLGVSALAALMLPPPSPAQLASLTRK
jgi:solute:Na+ symporter, SSS family